MKSQSTQLSSLSTIPKLSAHVHSRSVLLCSWSRPASSLPNLSVPVASALACSASQSNLESTLLPLVMSPLPPAPMASPSALDPFWQPVEVSTSSLPQQRRLVRRWHPSGQPAASLTDIVGRVDDEGNAGRQGVRRPLLRRWCPSCPFNEPPRTPLFPGHTGGFSPFADVVVPTSDPRELEFPYMMLPASLWTPNVHLPQCALITEPGHLMGQEEEQILWDW